jgi:hypothetical protein
MKNEQLNSQEKSKRRIPMAAKIAVGVAVLSASISGCGDTVKAEPGTTSSTTIENVSPEASPNQEVPTFDALIDKVNIADFEIDASIDRTAEELATAFLDRQDAMRNILCNQDSSDTQAQINEYEWNNGNLNYSVGDFASSVMPKLKDKIAPVYYAKTGNEGPDDSLDNIVSASGSSILEQCLAGIGLNKPTGDWTRINSDLNIAGLNESGNNNYVLSISYAEHTQTAEAQGLEYKYTITKEAQDDGRVVWKVLSSSHG